MRKHISEVSRELDLNVFVIRMWIVEFAEFLEQDKGQKFYFSNKEFETMKQIKQLIREEKFSIEGAKRHLRKKC